MAQFTGPAPFVRSFSFPDREQRVTGGCAVVVAPGAHACPIANPDDSDDSLWGDAEIAAFLAGEPLSLGWVSQTPPHTTSERAYVCCWLTIDND